MYFPMISAGQSEVLGTMVFFCPLAGRSLLYFLINKEANKPERSGAHGHQKQKRVHNQDWSFTGLLSKLHKVVLSHC